LTRSAGRHSQISSRILGEIEDLVVTFVSGRLVALVIDTREQFKVGRRHRAVVCDIANRALASGKDPVRLAISKADLEAAPTIATKAPHLSRPSRAIRCQQSDMTARGIYVAARFRLQRPAGSSGRLIIGALILVRPAARWGTSSFTPSLCVGFPFLVLRP
jgi:hypothetical protein